MAGELFRATAQVGLESTYGTGVAASRIVYLNDQPVITRTRDPRPRQFATGGRDNQRAATLGPVVAGGSVAFPLSADEIIEWALATIQGGVTPTMPTGATNGKLWTFTSAGLTLNSLTMEYNDGAQALRGLGVYGDTMTIAGSANAEAMATFELFAKDRDAHALTGSLTSRTPTYFEGYETLSYLDSFGGTPGGSLIPSFLTQWTFSYSNNLQRKYLADNRNVMNRAVLAPMTATAQVTVEASNAQALTELANWDALTKRVLTLRFGGNDPIAGDTAVNNVQTGTISGSPSSGSIALVVLGVTTAPVLFNATGAQVASAIQTALQTAFGTDYTVSGSGGAGGPWAITFTGALAGQDVPIITNGASTFDAGTVGWVRTTPGYSAKRTIWLDIPGFWSAHDAGQTDAGTRTYQMSMTYLYDPTNAFGFRMRVQNGRATAW